MWIVMEGKENKAYFLFTMTEILQNQYVDRTHRFVTRQYSLIHTRDKS